MQSFYEYAKILSSMTLIDRLHKVAQDAQQADKTLPVVVNANIYAGSLMRLYRSHVASLFASGNGALIRELGLPPACVIAQTLPYLSKIVDEMHANALNSIDDAVEGVELSAPFLYMEMKLDELHDAVVSAIKQAETETAQQPSSA